MTELGIVTEVRPVQSRKAALSIDVTELGIVTEVRPLHSRKEYSPIEMTVYFLLPSETTEGMVISPETLLPGKLQNRIDSPGLVLQVLAFSSMTVYDSVLPAYVYSKSRAAPDSASREHIKRSRICFIETRY